MRARRYVVTRPLPESGIGSNLSSLAGAVLLARALGRDVVVDWRGMAQLRNKDRNYFVEFFATPPAIAGTRVLYAPSEEPAGPSESRRLSPQEVAEILRVRDDSGLPRYLVLERYHGVDRIAGGGDARDPFMREVYGRIELRPALRHELEGWSREHLGGRPVIGANFRSGDEALFRPGATYHRRLDIRIFENRRTFLRKVVKASRTLARSVGVALDECALFCATDTAWMHDLLTAMPNAVARRSVYPPPESGHTHAFDRPDYTDDDGVRDTLIDMFLLARCDALVHNSSLFNLYARVVTGDFGGRMVPIESMYVRKRVAYRLARGLGALRRTRRRPLLPQRAHGPLRRTR